jgi:hypothetical protein
LIWELLNDGIEVGLVEGVKLEVKNIEQHNATNDDNRIAKQLIGRKCFLRRILFYKRSFGCYRGESTQFRLVG